MAAKGVGVIMIIVCGVWSCAATSANDIAIDAADDQLQDYCQQKMDLVFLQDASYSVSNDSFQAAKTFLSRLVTNLKVSQDTVRVALVRFGTYADVIAPLTQSHDVTTVTRAIQAMEYKQGGTQTGRALKTVREEVLNRRRPSARAVVVVITDGKSMNFAQTREEAEKLRQQDVRLVWLYITASAANFRALRREKRYMAGQGDATLQADSFEALGQEARGQILNASCKEDPPQDPETTPRGGPTPPSVTPSSPSHLGPVTSSSGENARDETTMADISTNFTSISNVTENYYDVTDPESVTSSSGENTRDETTVASTKFTSSSNVTDIDYITSPVSVTSSSSHEKETTGEELNLILNTTSPTPLNSTTLFSGKTLQLEIASTVDPYVNDSSSERIPPQTKPVSENGWDLAVKVTPPSPSFSDMTQDMTTTAQTTSSSAHVTSQEPPISSTDQKEAEAENNSEKVSVKIDDKSSKENKSSTNLAKNNTKEIPTTEESNNRADLSINSYNSSTIPSHNGDGEKGEGEKKGEGEWGENVWNVVGVSVGGFAIVALASGAVIYYALRRRRQKERKERVRRIHDIIP